MKLIVDKKYKINEEIVVYTGQFGGGFKCYECHKPRLKVHEFLVFPNEADANKYIETGNDSLWTNSYHYGSECIKHINISVA